MGAHMLPGRERWRARRRSIRFTAGVIIAVPVLAAVAMWAFAGATIGDAIANHGQTAQHGTVLVRIALADAVGLVATIIAAIAMAWFARRLFSEISTVEVTARRFADQQFPALVERLRRGEELDLEAELPVPAQVKTTEVVRVATAVASIQQTALSAAATETSLRTGISQVFVSLARRSLSLLQRQLRLIDDLEEKAIDPATLADLFPLDHLTTRMRRHAEGLIILSGSAPGRGWTSPVPVIDVVRGAVAEVEDYKRVEVVTDSEDMVAGSVVADMIHLLAELIENATLFSPSGTRVEVRAERVGNGFAFEIEDRGLGIKPDELDAINGQLGSPADFDLANADQLGLFVVGKLAARHSVRVFLRPSPYGGTTAIVLMPNSIITSAAEAARPMQPAEGETAPALGRGLELAMSGRTERPTQRTESPAPRRQVFAGLPPVGGTSVPGRPDSDPGLSAIGISAPGASPADPAFPLREPTFLGQRVVPGQASAGSSQPGVAVRPPAAPQPPRGGPDSDTHRGLPRRVRQANLSPHLRAKPARGSATPSREPEMRSPEQAQKLLSSLQSGWERGREAEKGPESPDTGGAQNSADGAREAPQEGT